MPPADPVLFHGSQAEALVFVDAVRRYCAAPGLDGEHCMPGTMARPGRLCAAHRLMCEDQRAVNGLLFWRRHRLHLVQQEWAFAALPPADEAAIAALIRSLHA